MLFSLDPFLMSYVCVGGYFNGFAILHQIDMASFADGDHASDDTLRSYRFKTDLVTLDRLPDRQTDVAMPSK